MDSDLEKAEEFSDTEDPLSHLSVDDEEEEQEGDEEKEEEDDEEDAKIFNAWMLKYKGGEHHEKPEKEDAEEEDPETGQLESGSTTESPVKMRADRRASLPCPSALSSIHLSRLHSSTRAPVTASVLLRRSSSRRLLPLPQEATAPTPERRPSIISTIPKTIVTEKRATFRRRNVMSLSDADSVCLICHNDLSKGTGGTTELQCSHSFHKECIQEWLWRKQFCPTCRVQVSMPQPVFWSSTRDKVP
ncbi:histone H3.v1 [Takifugu flavidus]|uniref:RING-type domain-containing protein n=2 Tax=Takifugu TaxID=31032 RepID=A0A5C6NEC5_9TELE|nr:histone H3.v1 [Takifugu flavidus]TNM94076.1 hypothetical protein fugu_002252 [Takifugu bimaculatus]TWW63877.1 hypothetical protein D4764_03G0008850 [Takifugu flavidus]